MMTDDESVSLVCYRLGFAAGRFHEHHQLTWVDPSDENISTGTQLLHGLISASHNIAQATSCTSASGVETAATHLLESWENCGSPAHKELLERRWSQYENRLDGLLKVWREVYGAVRQVGEVSDTGVVTVTNAQLHVTVGARLGTGDLDQLLNCRLSVESVPPIISS